MLLAATRAPPCPSTPRRPGAGHRTDVARRVPAVVVGRVRQGAVRFLSRSPPGGGPLLSHGNVRLVPERRHVRARKSQVAVRDSAVTAHARDAQCSVGLEREREVNVAIDLELVTQPILVKLVDFSEGRHRAALLVRRVRTEHVNGELPPALLSGPVHKVGARFHAEVEAVLQEQGHNDVPRTGHVVGVHAEVKLPVGRRVL
mmetsp:Transcript_17134/g.31077  ORF Transcript_17134/g.31077 Transcript_17134/m.31077 type:complete len:202 (+) Transcript_17134:23-628(+)